MPPADVLPFRGASTGWRTRQSSVRGNAKSCSIKSPANCQTDCPLAMQPCATEAKALLAGEGEMFLSPSLFLSALMRIHLEHWTPWYLKDIWSSSSPGPCMRGWECWNLARGEEKTWGRSWHLTGGNEDGGARLFSVVLGDRTKWTQVS